MSEFEDLFRKAREIGMFSLGRTKLLPRREIQEFIDEVGSFRG